jgi:hypothetical protein
VGPLNDLGWVFVGGVWFTKEKEFCLSLLGDSLGPELFLFLDGDSSRMRSNPDSSLSPYSSWMMLIAVMSTYAPKGSFLSIDLLPSYSVPEKDTSLGLEIEVFFFF